MPLIRLFLFASLAVAFATTSLAQQREDTTAVLEARLEEITVTASRIRIDAAAAPQRVTLLDEADIERTGARDVGELLSRRAGMFIRQYGEGLATPSLRGASPSQTLILLDGMRLADPQLGQLDLSLFPTYALSGVEVMHGPGSALFGTDGIGGVVNLRPRKAEEDEIRVSSEVGAFGARRAGAGASFAADDRGAVVAAEYAEAQGDFPYLNEALFPPREVRRRNADRRTRSVYASAFAEAGSHRVEGAMLFADAVRGLPGLAAANPAGERQWDEHFRVWMSDEVGLRRGRMAVRGFVHRSRLRYANPAVDVDDSGRTWMGGVEAERIVPVSSGWILDVGASAGYAAADHPNLSEDASEIHGAAFGEAVGRTGSITLYPALRADVYGGHRFALSPRLGANLPLADGAIHVKAAFGRAFRNPTFNERYWRPGGNPALSPERAWSFETGVHAELAGASAVGGGGTRDGQMAESGARGASAVAPIVRGNAEITVFGARARDQIVWMPEGGEVWAPENVTRTSTLGLEASTHAVLRLGSARVEGGAVYTYTRAVDRSDPEARTFGRQLRYVPRHVGKGYAGISLGAIRLDATARWLGRRFVTADESEWMDPNLVVDLQAAVDRTLGPVRATVAVMLENALDAEYAVIQQYPMPPRHLRVRLVIQTN